MVVARREGRHVLYRVVSARLEALLADMERIRASLTGDGGVFGS